MDRTDVLLHQDDEYVVMEDPDGWKLMLMAVHLQILHLVLDRAHQSQKTFLTIS